MGFFEFRLRPGRDILARGLRTHLGVMRLGGGCKMRFRDAVFDLELQLLDGLLQLLVLAHERGNYALRLLR